MAEPQPRWEGFHDTETINGVELRLGEMTLDQLMELETACHERVLEAETDLSIVRDHRLHLFPDALADVVSIDVARLRRRGTIRELNP